MSHRRNRYRSPLYISESSDSENDSGLNAGEKEDGLADQASLFSPGMRSEVKNLYEGKPKCRCCTNWVDEIPKDTVAKMKASKRNREYAVILRHKRDTEALDGELKLDSIVIQSPLLRPVLEQVFKDLPGTVGGLKKLEFSAPFVPFFHRWTKFEMARSTCEGETRDHADLLYNALHKQVQHDISTSQDLITHGVISFDYVWTLFVPGDLIAYSRGTHESLAIISQAEYFRDLNSKEVIAYTVTGRYVDMGRTGFGYSILVLALPKFNNTIRISEMMFLDVKDDSNDPRKIPVIPAKMRPDFESLKSRLVERGRKFKSLRGYHFKQYAGEMEEKFRDDGMEVSVWHNIAARIIVDVEAYENHMPMNQTDLIPLDAELTPQGDEVLNAVPTVADEFGHYSGLTMERRIRDCLMTVRNDSQDLKEDHLMLCSPKIKGYSLRNKIWAEFYVDLITDIEFNKAAFANLVLPETYRNLITSFVARHLSNKDGFDDFILGKGRGLIALLSGEPGVGKTLTAESVAEEMEAPLYALGVGELGSSAADVDYKLSGIFDLCSRWKAVLLLDEADVCLEQRTTSDMERNKIVSVFLRVLEYYEGMMFMTTNRVSSFDGAFRSRIHISMDYPPLNATARASIWSNFLKNPTLDVAITPEEIKKVAEMPMNGREIKNTIKIANLLAGQKNETLDIGHIASVVSINGFGGDQGYVLENDFRVL